LMLRARRDSNP